MILVEMSALEQNLRDLRREAVYNCFIDHTSILEQKETFLDVSVVCIHSIQFPNFYRQKEHVITIYGVLS